MKVSVIVPVYRAEKYLRQCADSILAQTLRDIEVILVDDGSPDACPQIVDEYAAKDARVVPVHQPNGGLSAARNAGLRIARGKYVGFVDSDDWIAPAMYEKLFSACESSGADVAACGIQCEFQSGGADVDQCYYDMKFEGLLPLNASLLEKIDVSVCNKLFRRVPVISDAKLRFPDRLNFEDCEFFWKFALRSKTIFCIRENLYHYVRHGSGIMKETMTGVNPHSIDAVKVCGNILRDLISLKRLEEFALPFFLLLTGHYGMSKRSAHPDTDGETRKILAAAHYRKYRAKLPDRENWAWEILDRLSEGKKISLRERIWHTKNCKGVSRTFFCGIRVRKEIIPEPDVVFDCPADASLPQEHKPKVSVVVPVYNTAPYLRQSLDAALAQTLREIEIICVNDGSTDGSLEILREYEKKDSRVRVISKPNAGYGHSVNVGIDAANGEYLAIAEPDDYTAPEMYETLYAAAREHRVPLVKCDWELFWETAGTETRRERWRLVSGAEDVSVFSPHENPTMVADASGIWAAVYDLAWLRGNGIRCLETPGASFQDTAFVMKTYLCAGRMAFVPRAFVSYRQTNPNSSINAGAAKAFIVFKEFDEIIRFCKVHGIFSERSKALILKKFRATGRWNIERFTGEISEQVKKRLRKYFRDLLKDIPERPPEINLHEWEYILEIADVREPLLHRVKAFFFEESFARDSVRIKLFRIRVLKTPLVRSGRDSLFRKIFIRVLAGAFFPDGQKRKAFRARHLNLNKKLIQEEAHSESPRRIHNLLNAIVPATRGKVEHTERHLRRWTELQMKTMLEELRETRESLSRIHHEEILCLKSALADLNGNFAGTAEAVISQINREVSETRMLILRQDKANQELAARKEKLVENELQRITEKFAFAHQELNNALRAQTEALNSEMRENQKRVSGDLKKQIDGLRKISQNASYCTELISRFLFMKEIFPNIADLWKIGLPHPTQALLARLDNAPCTNAVWGHLTQVKGRFIDEQVLLLDGSAWYLPENELFSGFHRLLEICNKQAPQWNFVLERCTWWLWRRGKHSEILELMKDFSLTEEEIPASVLCRFATSARACGQEERARRLMRTYHERYGTKDLWKAYAFARLSADVGRRDEDIDLVLEVGDRCVAENSADTLKKLIDGKRVAVVGNGPQEVGSGNGAKIDGYDIVVRFNDFPTDEKFKNDYGEKTDIWVRNLFSVCEPKKIPICVLGDFFWLEYPDLTVLREIHDSALQTILGVPANICYELHRRGLTPPTNGAMLLAWLKKIRPDFSVGDVYGFSFKDENPSKNFEHYYMSSSYADVRGSTIHMPDKERLFLRKLFDLGA